MLNVLHWIYVAISAELWLMFNEATKKIYSERQLRPFYKNYLKYSGRKENVFYIDAYDYKGKRKVPYISAIRSNDIFELLQFTFHTFKDDTSLCYIIVKMKLSPEEGVYIGRIDRPIVCF